MVNKSKGILRRFSKERVSPFHLIKDIITKRDIYLKLLIAIILSLSLAYLSSPSMPGKFKELKSGEVAPYDIIAPFDFPVYKDKESLEQERDSAIREVIPVYTINHQITEIALTQNHNFFQIIGGILKKKKPSLLERQEIALPDYSWNILSIREQREEMEDVVSQIIDSVMSCGVISETTSLKNQGILYMTIADGKGQINTTIDDLITIENLDDYLQNIVIDYYPKNDEKAQTAVKIARMMIRANLEKNTVATKHRIDEVLSHISPIKYWILKDEKIVEAHKRLTKEQELALSALNDNITRTRLALIWIGRAVLILAIVTILGVYIAKTHKNIYDNNRSLIFFAVILVILTGIGRLIVQFITPHYPQASLLFPAAFASILITVFFDLRVGLIMALLSGLLGGIIAGLDMRSAIVAIAGAIMGVLTTYKMRRYSDLIKTGAVIVIVVMIVVFNIGIVGVLPIGQILTMVFWSALGGILSVLLVWILIPSFEKMTGLSSSIRLIALSDLNHPLLRKLAMEASGTYHHSMNVGELSARSAAFLGANEILARVGGYYHDIGKLKNPYYFSENHIQGTKPHNKLSPQMSSLVIKKHIDDGVELADQWGLPEVMVDLIRQHHGTYLISFFYKAAIEEDRHGLTHESDFRYTGPKPKTIESVVIMIADASESTVRSLANPDPANIRNTVKTLVENRLHDGQFDEAPITLKGINDVMNVIIEGLIAIYHTRIKYEK
ncbi:MAG: HD family phosphohydrolase [bacterium]